MFKRFLFAALISACLATAASAEIKLHPLFSEGMVLQQNAPCLVWGTADPGEEIRVFLRYREKPESGSGSYVTTGKDGKWLTGIGEVGKAELRAGGPYQLIVTSLKDKKEITVKNVYVGEVWVASGQSNMGMTVNSSAGADEAKKTSANPKLRLFTVKHTIAATPQTTVPVDKVNGVWQEAGPETIGNFSAVAYYFGRDLQKALDVPVGIIHTSWGGTRAEAWTSRPVLEADPLYKGEFLDPATLTANYERAMERYKVAVAAHTKAVEKAKAEGKDPPPAPRAPVKPGEDPNAPSVLYNGMIAPLIPFAIKGVIWYQGESNAGKAEQYRNLFPKMIQNWRDDWKQGDFPFLFVQLAPFQAKSTEPTDTDWARLRDAQLFTSQKVKNTAMAVITDVGDEKDIHPKRKAEVGHRLALVAQSLAYEKSVEGSGPVFDKMTVEGNKAILTFKHATGGLSARDGTLTGFTIAGADKYFHNAEAEIDGDTVVVTCKEVEKPVAVRFGWANYPVVNLWNKVGLPASPFRTDDWAKGVPLNERGARLEKLSGEFKFTEGPASDADGNVYFTDQPNDRILKWSTDGKLSTFLQPCGRSNGLCFDAKGNLWACADEKNELWSIDPAGKVTVVVKDYKGKLLNGPNDIWIRPDGGMYLTDPYYKRDYWKRGPKEQDCEAVYYLDPEHKNLTRVADDLQQPNGIIGTPDGKILYVSDIKGNKTYAYDIQEDGTLKNKRLFCDLGSDGMTIDNEGNVYLTGKGVTVFDKTGKRIEQIAVAEPWTANVCFGGKDRRTLFITASTGFYSLRMRVKGVGSQ
jgi:sialate O-acetylesterase